MALCDGRFFLSAGTDLKRKGYKMTTYTDNFATIAEQARAWKAEQDARPIAKTVSLCAEAYESARELASTAYDVERLARSIMVERYVSASDTAEIKESIINTQDLIFALICKLEDAKASLAGAVEAGE